MTIDRGILDRLRTRGEEVLTQLSAELTSNPGFMKAMEGAIERATRGREMLEQAAARALHEMNVSSHSELKRANSRIEALEREVAQLRARARSAAGGKAPTARKTARRARAKSGRVRSE